MAEEFTVEMSRAVTALPDAEEVLRALTQQNASVTRLPGRGELPLPPHDERVRRAALCPAAHRPANGGLAAVMAAGQLQH